ncbi:MAG TPA: type II secretion system minor pseudopilin GspK [Xanthomonadaceae bacterium]|nr:type II secretion system minor pseudopilin GspK [Xanthomonadaceae bacterium]
MNTPRMGSTHARSARGAALILVLWLLVLLTAVIGGFAQSARIEALQAHQLRASLVARQAARAGVEYAALRMQYPDMQRRWVPDGRRYGLTLGDAQLEIHVIDESGKIDLNGAPPELLAKLLLALGVEPLRARNLAAAIVDYRDPDDLVTLGGAESADYSSAGLPYGPKNKPFETVSELQRVLGMDFALYQKLVPNVTVYTSSEPSPTFAQPPVLQALGMSGAAAELFQNQRESWQPGSPQAPPVLPGGQPFVVQPGSGIYDISCRAHLRDGTSLTVDAIVRASQTGPFGQLYVPLQWREGESY